MQQAIEDGGGQHVVAKDGAPLRHDLIGRDQHAAALVAACDQLEEEMGAASLERQVAELVDDQQLGLAEKHQAVRQLPVGLGPCEGGEQCGGADEKDRVASLDDGAPESNGEMRLADARRTKDEDVFRLREKAAGGELTNQPLVDGRL